MADGKFSRVHFRVRSSVRLGESMGIGGSGFELGNFSHSKVIPLVTTPETYPIWQTSKPIVVPRDQVLNYNYCLLESGRVKMFESRDKRVVVPQNFDFIVEDECPADTLQAFSVEDDLQARLRKRAESINEQEDCLSHYKRVIIVCYHLPIEISRTNNPESPFEITWAESLIAKSTRNSIAGTVEVLWVGTMPSVGPTTAREDEILLEELTKMNCTPIFFNQDIVQASYVGFCKQVLWPLFHNVDQLDHLHAAWNFPSAPTNLSPFMASVPATETIINWEQNPSYWEAYQAMNEKFVPLLRTLMQSGDVVWIHDYHLTLLPGLIREQLAEFNAWTVYFSHIPFPTSQIFRSLPQATIILRSMLAADLVGFHSFDDARHFLIAAKRMLGIPAHTRAGGILSLVVEDREVVVSMNHVSVEPDLIADAVNHPETLRHMEAIRNKYPDKKIIVGVDTCQRLSGLAMKFAAFEQMMSDKPQIANIVLIQKGIRTGARIADEETTSKDIVVMADRINSKIRKYQHQTHGKYIDYEEVSTLSIYERVALWLVADVFLLTSIREGLNLRPLEYMYARKNSAYAGVVVVSEFTACASLLSGSLKINPYNTQDVADTMLKALTMKKDEASRRTHRDLPFLETHPSAQWTREILSDLNYIRDACLLVRSDRRNESGYPSPLDVSRYVESFRQSSKISSDKLSESNRVFIFDYGGTIVKKESFEVYIKQVASSISAKGPAEAMFNALKKLSENPENEIVVMTGLTRDRLGDAFKGCDNITLATSNGLVHSWGKRLAASTSDEGALNADERRWEMLDFSYIDWSAVKAIAEPIMTKYTFRTNGSVIAPRVLSLGWSYFGADPDWGEIQAKNICVELEAALAMHDVKVVSHITGVIEILPRGLHKGVMVREVMRRVLAKRQGAYPSFLSVFGNDKNDDLMYSTVSSLLCEASLTTDEGASSLVDQITAYSVNIGCRLSPAQLFVLSVQELEGLVCDLAEDSTI